MTTWDLFLLRRNQERLGWTTEQVLPIFYRDGRINPIAEHYEEIGVLAHVWTKAIGIVPSRAFPKGSRLAVLVGDLFTNCRSAKSNAMASLRKSHRKMAIAELPAMTQAISAKKCVFLS